MKIIGVIPARYESSRFPGKPLAEILGKPMISYVIQIVAKALGNENTYVATDSLIIKNYVESLGIKAVMTSSECLTGTDRLWDFAQKVKADIYINVQGDEPVVDPNDVQKIAKIKAKNINYVINGMCTIQNDEDPRSVNIPKVLATQNGDLVYMSRLPIPGNKSGDIKDIEFKKQVCIYGFTYEELEKFGNYGKKASFEEHEDIEILRFLELGIPVKMVEISKSSIAVDIPSDIKKVEQYLINNGAIS